MSESKTPTPACEAMSGTRRLAIGQRAESAVNRTDVEAMEQVCLEDVPALLEQLEDVDRLRGELAAVVGENNRLTGAATEIEADRNILRTEQAAVFAALRDALGTSPATVGQAAVHAVNAIQDRDTELKRLRSELDDLAAQNAKTESNFEEFAEVIIPERDGLAEEIRKAAAYLIRRADLGANLCPSECRALADDLRAALNGTEADR